MRMKFWEYPVKVFIFEQRANSEVLRIDKARRVTKKGESEKYYIKGVKKHTKPIDYKYIYHTTKGKAYLFLYSPNPDDFFPMKIKRGQREIVVKQPDGTEKTIKMPNLNIRNVDMEHWRALQYREAYSKWTKKTVLEKYMGLIQLIAVGMVMAVIFYVILTNIEVLFTNLHAGINAQSQALERVAEAMEIIAGRQTVTSSQPIPVPH